MEKCDVISLVLTAAALIVAFLTLLSQIATQRNTAPLIKVKTQKMLWFFLIKQLYYKIQYLHILKIKLQRCKYKMKPEEGFVQRLCISPDSYLHEEFFYKKKYVKYYGKVHWIKKHITDYNMYVNSIASHLNQNNITPQNFDRLFNMIDELSSSLLDNYLLIFKVCEGKLRRRLDEELFQRQQNEIKQKEEIKFPFGSLKECEKYYRKDEYVKFYGASDTSKESFYYKSTNRYIELKMNDGKVVLVSDKT